MPSPQNNRCAGKLLYYQLFPLMSGGIEEIGEKIRASMYYVQVATGDGVSEYGWGDFGGLLDFQHTDAWATPVSRGACP